ncbi:MAG TPA: hypothetical protein VF623_05490 [Segetibacter sp.]
MKITFLLLILVSNITTKAQAVRQPLTVRYACLGAYSKNFVDIFSATVNQASLAETKTGGFGVYGERRFMLQDLNSFTTLIALPVKSGAFGLQGDYFGSAAFNENQLGVMYARKITGQVDIGVKFNYHTVRVPGYGSATAINFEAGTIIHLTDKLHTGVHVYNPTRSKLGKSGGEKLASIYRFGLGYEASSKVFVSTEIVKQENQPVNVNAGLQYNVQDKFFMRIGISTTSSNSYFGAGFNLTYARIDINATYHPQLGFTPGLLLLLNFKKPATE